MLYDKALPGHFYAVGVGPGSPDLLTLRAARVIETADLIITPQAKGSTRSLALEAIRPLLKDQQVICANYPMERNGQATRERWQQLADTVMEHCRNKLSVVQITLGDPLIFATSSYLLQSLTDQLAEGQVHIIPGISAFQTGASRFGEALTLQEDRLTLMSATDLDAVSEALDHCETLVLYKAAGVIQQLLEILAERKLLGTSRLISCAEQGEHELVIDSLQGWQPGQLNYMTTLIVRIGSRKWQ